MREWMHLLLRHCELTLCDDRVDVFRSKQSVAPCAIISCSWGLQNMKFVTEVSGNFLKSIQKIFTIILNVSLSSLLQNKVANVRGQQLVKVELLQAVFFDHFSVRKSLVNGLVTKHVWLCFASHRFYYWRYLIIILNWDCVIIRVILCGLGWFFRRLSLWRWERGCLVHRVSFQQRSHLNRDLSGLLTRIFKMHVLWVLILKLNYKIDKMWSI
jgi:hypothetical protein